MRGLRVRLFEREVFGGIRPGETLHPGVEPLLDQLGVAPARFLAVVGSRHEGIVVDWGGRVRFVPFGADGLGPWSGFQVRRAEFDAMLLERARAVGVDVCQPCAVFDFTIRGGADCSVASAAGHVNARLVIDASGRSEWLCRRLGIERLQYSPRLIARYGYADGVWPERDSAPRLAGNERGWLWTAKVWPGTYQWTRVALGDEAAVSSRGVPEQMRHLVPRGKPRGADVTWRAAVEPAREGWFMVGDAAAILDPASSHGVLKALVSGITAGHLVHGVLGRSADALAAATAYREWFTGWFAEDVSQLSRFYRELGVAGFD